MLSIQSRAWLARTINLVSASGDSSRTAWRVN